MIIKLFLFLRDVKEVLWVQNRRPGSPIACLTERRAHIRLDNTFLVLTRLWSVLLSLLLWLDHVSSGVGPFLDCFARRLSVSATSCLTVTKSVVSSLAASLSIFASPGVSLREPEKTQQRGWKLRWCLPHAKTLTIALVYFVISLSLVATNCLLCVCYHFVPQTKKQQKSQIHLKKDFQIISLGEIFVCTCKDELETCALLWFYLLQFTDVKRW